MSDGKHRRPLYYPRVTKLRVGVLYGGRSGEHEVSVASAASILRHLDHERYEAVPILIRKDGRWSLPARPPTMVSAAEVIGRARLAHAPPASWSEPPAHAHPREPDRFISVGDEVAVSATVHPSVPKGLDLDVVFPVLHGPYGEDGTVQGFLELADVPYVGAGVLASAVGMDKVVMKHLFEARGLPVTPWRALVASDWSRRREEVTTDVLALGLPVFVKPANLGSSVGISKVKTTDALGAAIDEALTFDRKVIVEAGVPDPREIECAVLGNDDPEASVAGEIIPSREFYDYESKYVDQGSRTIIPADLQESELADVQRWSIEAFKAIDGAGLSRVDFLLSRTTGALLINEINTMPGFTTISMFAKLWEASGVPYGTLLDRLIALAVERHQARQRLRTSVL